jgi:hypothetical protein
MDQEQKQQAVSFVDDVPHLELAALEYVFPISVQDGQFKLLLRMKAARASAIKRIYDQLMIKRKSRGRSETEYRTTDSPGVKSFIDDHFISMDGATLEDGNEPSLDDQREWLNQNESFKVRIFREGYDAFTDGSVDEEQAAVKGKPVLVLSKPDHNIKVRWVLYSDETKSEAKLNFTVTMEKLVKADTHQYEKAFRLIENTKTNERYIESNWDVVESLFDRKAKKITGALLSGAPCDESTRDQWVKLLPFSLKVFVLAKMVEEVEIKNG